MRTIPFRPRTETRLLLFWGREWACGHCGGAVTPGPATQGSLLPWRHRHVPVYVTAEEYARSHMLRATFPRTEELPPGQRARYFGGRASKAWGWLKRRGLTWEQRHAPMPAEAEGRWWS
jgi:hypothetical protein